MSKMKWGAVAAGVASLLLLGLSISPHQARAVGPLVETSPGIYSQDFSASLIVPKWALYTSAALFGLAGTLLIVAKKQGAS